MKKVTAVTLAALMTTALFSGCSSSGDKEPAASATTAPTQSGQSGEVKKDPVTLNAWIMPNSPKPDEDFLAALKPYLDQNKHVTVKVTILDWGSAWTKITTAATSGQGPDIMQLGTTWVPAIASMNGIDDISSKVSQVGGSDAYIPASWNTTMIKGESKVYGIPWFVDARAIYYRKDAFQQAGVDPKSAFATWDSFKEALKKVNGVTVDGQKMSAFGVPGKNDWNVVHNIFPWVWGAGGEAISEDGKKAVFNSDNGVNGIMFYTGLAHEGLVDKSSLEKNSAQIESDFGDGKTAVMISGPWMLKNFATSADAGGMGDKAAAKNYGVAPLPAGPNGQATFIGGSNLTVFKGSKNKDAAWDVIKYLSSDEAQMAYSKLSGQLPAKKALIESPELTKDSGFAAFSEAVKKAKTYPSIPQWGPTETALQKYFGNVWDIVAGVNGTYSIESVKKQLDQAAKEVDAILNQ